MDQPCGATKANGDVCGKPAKYHAADNRHMLRCGVHAKDDGQWVKLDTA